MILFALHMEYECARAQNLSDMCVWLTTKWLLARGLSSLGHNVYTVNYLVTHLLDSVFTKEV